MPDATLYEIIDMVWDFIRGDMLKRKFEAVKSRLDHIVEKFKGRNADYRDSMNFRRKYVYNVLFGYTIQDDRGYKWPQTFQMQYEKFLHSAGYREGGKGFRKSDDTRASKVPGGMIAPHIMLILTRHMEAVCEVIYDAEKVADIDSWCCENIRSGRETKYTLSAPESMKTYFSKNPEILTFADIELLVWEYFMQVRIGWERAKFENPDIAGRPLFVEKSYSICYKNIKRLEFGNGSRNKKIYCAGGKIDTVKENPGVLESFRNQLLFDKDEAWCLEYRRKIEYELCKLHTEYSLNPSDDLVPEIKQLESEIRNENMALYNHNLGVFVGVPEILVGKQFIKRPWISERIR